MLNLTIQYIQRNYYSIPITVFHENSFSKPCCCRQNRKPGIDFNDTAASKKGITCVQTSN